MRVVLGGTFDPLHDGHKALFKRAFDLGFGDTIIIGLTSDAMAADDRSRVLKPFKARKKILEEYLLSMLEKYQGTTFEIVQINEVFNKAITQERDEGVLVVSEGRIAVADETNKYRKKFGKPPLEIVVVPYVLAQDGQPITATRIANGELDAEGNLLGLVKVAVGTENDVKLQGVKNIFEKVYSRLELIRVPVSSGVPDQPYGEETRTGAINRGEAALKKVPDAHFGVGIEAGLFIEDKTGHYFDVQYCAIHDRGGRVTVGHGPGFYYPPKVVEGLNRGQTVGEVMAEITGTSDIGHKQGAIGYLTGNILKREGLTEQAVLMAMVPRISRLYD